VAHVAAAPDGKRRLPPGQIQAQPAKEQKKRSSEVARYHATVESRSSAAETFRYLAAFSNAAEWDPGVLSGEQLDPGPVRAGSRFRLVVPFLGVRTPLTYEVTRLVPGREVLLGAVSGVLRSTDTIVVTGDADGSMVSYDAEVRLRGPLRVLDPILRPGFRAVAERAAAGLAGALSRRPPGPGTRTPGAAPPRSGGAAQPAGGRP
jgi:hypothetical protein